jgi:hypothetical protein
MAKIEIRRNHKKSIIQAMCQSDSGDQHVIYFLSMEGQVFGTIKEF